LVVVGGGDAIVDVGELSGDPVLLGLEQVDRDSLGVVRLKQFGSLVEEP
jgi:hypothetical protein